MNTFKEQYGQYGTGALAEDKPAKFERATKTDVHYTGTINGKTWVVPHSFHGSGDVLHGTKVTPMRHNIVVSPVHVQHNNPTLKPEEAARVHQHIKAIHGGQEGKAPQFDSMGKLEEDLKAEWNRDFTKNRRANIKRTMKQQMNPKAPGKGGKAWLRADKEDRARTGRQMALSTVQSRPYLHEAQRSKEVPEVQHAEKKYKKEHTPEYQAERDKYRHAALAASRKAATLAFAKKHHLLEIKNMLKPTQLNELNKKVMGDMFTYHRTQIAKKTLRMPDAMVGVMGGMNKDEARKHLKTQGWDDKKIHKHEHDQFVSEHVWNVTDHLGHQHDVEAKDKTEALKKTVSVGSKIHPEGVGMSHWHKIRIEKKVMEEGAVENFIKHRNFAHEYDAADKAESETPGYHEHINRHMKRYHETEMRKHYANMTPKEQEKHRTSLHERTLSPGEEKKKEEIVKGMKKNLQSFKSRYGERAKEVMYATATKKGKELAESSNKMFPLPLRNKKKSIISTSKPIGHKIADVGAGGKEHNIKRVGPGSEKLEEMELTKYKTGDGKKHQTFDDAKRHAETVHKKTGNIISVERLKEEMEQLTTLEEAHALKSNYATADGHSHTVKSSFGRGKFSGTVHTSHRDNRYSYTGPEARSPVEHEKPKKWEHDTRNGTRPSDVRKKNPHLDHTQAEAISNHFHEHRNKVAQLSEEQLNELKMPKTGFFDPDLRDVASRVHDMGHRELVSLHKSYEKNPPRSTVQRQQHHSIKKALRKYGDPQGTHNYVDKAKFVKKDLKEEHSDTYNTIKRVLRGE